MSLKQHLKESWERAKQHAIFEEFPAEELEAATKYAQAAYDYCVALYGQPLDSQKPYFVQRAITGRSFCRYMFGNYYLVIDKTLTMPEQICTDIAHEMFHRVTYKLKGFAGEMWVQEMMAVLTSNWFLRKQGFQEYAEGYKLAWLESQGKADAVVMRASQRREQRDWVLHGGVTYSDVFQASLGRIAYALIRIVDGNDLCRIIKATSVEEWISSLPQEDQYAVCRILELPCDDKLRPETERAYSRLFNSLKTKGDTEGLLAEFQQTARLHPSNGLAAFYLGCAYQQAKQFDLARDAYLKAVELDFSDKWLPYRLAICYWHLEDFSSASEWFQKTAECNPNWAKAHYWLGRSLNNLGHVREAHEAWNKVLALDNKEFTGLAEKAMEKNPLPDSQNASDLIARSAT